MKLGADNMALGATPRSYLLLTIVTPVNMAAVRT